MSEAENPNWRQRLLHPGNSWIWLAYLPLYFVTWIGRPPERRDLLVSLAGLAFFLFLYFQAEKHSKLSWHEQVGGDGWERRRDLGVILPSIAAMVLAVALIPFGANWSVIAIYACSMAADARPARDALRLVAAFILVSVVAAVAIGIPWYFVLMFAVFEIMVVFGKMSGMAIARKNIALERAQEEVRLLAQTAERERIARDLHDLLGRTLTLIALKSDLAVKLDDAEAARREMREVGEAARDGLSQVRAAISGMTHAGLGHEIEASRAALAAAGIACEVEGEALAVPADAGAVLAMALREGVTNVIRHAGAKSCRIAITEDEGELKLLVSDDGQGGRFREGAGLKGMRARLAAAGGKLRIRAGQGGTSLAAAIPAGLR